MTINGRLRRKPPPSGEFTLNAKSRSRYWAASLVLPILGTPAGALSPMGPTASHTVEISLSVAPRFGIETARPAAQLGRSAAGDSYCMAANGRHPALPILLLRSTRVGADAAGGEIAELLPRCLPDEPLQRASVPAAGNGGTTLLIVRPE